MTREEAVGMERGTRVVVAGGHAPGHGLPARRYKARVENVVRAAVRVTVDDDRWKGPGSLVVRFKDVDLDPDFAPESTAKTRAGTAPVLRAVPPPVVVAPRPPAPMAPPVVEQPQHVDARAEVDAWLEMGRDLLARHDATLAANRARVVDIDLMVRELEEEKRDIERESDRIRAMAAKVRELDKASGGGRA